MQMVHYCRLRTFDALVENYFDGGVEYSYGAGRIAYFDGAVEYFDGAVE